jgi:hypothetical protein
MEPGSQNNATSQGKLVTRFRYPDGRLTAVCVLAGQWQVIVFACEEDAVDFAKLHNLQLKEMNRDTPD